MSAHKTLSYQRLEPQPYITIVKPAEDYYAQRHPGPEDIFLIVEVADTSLEYDRQVKSPLYASAHIPEFWLVNLNDREIEGYHTPIDTSYKHRELCRPGDTMTFFSFNLSIEVDELLGI